MSQNNDFSSVLHFSDCIRRVSCGIFLFRLYFFPEKIFVFLESSWNNSVTIMSENGDEAKPNPAGGAGDAPKNEAGEEYIKLR